MLLTCRTLSYSSRKRKGTTMKRDLTRQSGRLGRKCLAVLLGTFVTCAMVVGAGTSARANGTEEQQLGAQLFAQLKSQGEIVKSSPLYDVLKPIAAAITKVVQPQYQYPIHFYIVHETQPNALAAPGGNVYVIDSLLYFVKNAQELEGTLCHETSHLLNHDSETLMKRDNAIRTRAVAATILLGPSIGTALAMTGIARLDSLHNSRAAEGAADLKGADTCAAAGYDPWGLVWLFQDFSAANLKTPPEILSDHPNDSNRIAQLKAHFAANPSVFGAFNQDAKLAAHLQLPKNEAEQFLR
jgi:predicted Zn-dependent protease